MRLAKLITPKKINVLWRLRLTFSVLLFAFFSPAFSQDNSPYTRYGLGDIVPSTNINSRGIGGVSAAYNDFYTINFNNPASYGSFQAYKELNSNKLRLGRAILDLGINIENRTLIEPNNATAKFPTSNALFSHVQVGVPLKANWGLSFGLRPMTRVSYRMYTGGRVIDAGTGLPADSTLTLSEGDGGAYLASMGTGFRIKNFSFGVNAGYLFGKTDYSNRVIILNDTMETNSGNFQTRTNFGSLYYNLGMQYQVNLDSVTFLTFGLFGNVKQNLNARQDITRETYFYDPNSGNIPIDSVFEKNEVKGEITYPASITGGFTLQKLPTLNKAGWLVGLDYHRAQWDDYRSYGKKDSSVRNKWEVRIGGELRPSAEAFRKSYFGRIIYRAGFFFGPDYVHVGNKLPMMGASFGLGLPINSENRFNPTQRTILNLAFEYIKRGNNDNILKENMFRISLGFSLSDFWFVKKTYE